MDAATAAGLSADKKTFIREHLGPKSLAAYTEIVGYMSRQSADVTGPEFWYLSILGLTPDSQGQGLGKDLMAPVLAKIDALGLGAYAESFTPKNFSFYERLGFTRAKRVDEPLTGSGYAILVRQPRAIAYRFQVEPSR